MVGEFVGFKSKKSVPSPKVPVDIVKSKSLYDKISNSNYLKNVPSTHHK